MTTGTVDEARQAQAATPRSQKRALFAILGEQRRFVYMAVVLLSLAGVWAALGLPSAIYPELEFSRVTIVVQGTSLGARQVLFSITRPIEEAVSIVPGVTRILPRLVPLAALGIMVVTASATGFHLVRGELVSGLTTAVLFVMAAFVAYMRLRVRPLPARAVLNRTLN